MCRTPKHAKGVALAWSATSEDKSNKLRAMQTSGCRPHVSHCTQARVNLGVPAPLRRLRKGMHRGLDRHRRRLTLSRPCRGRICKPAPRRLWDHNLPEPPLQVPVLPCAASIAWAASRANSRTSAPARARPRTSNTASESRPAGRRSPTPRREVPCSAIASSSSATPRRASAGPRSGHPQASCANAAHPKRDQLALLGRFRASTPSRRSARRTPRRTSGTAVPTSAQTRMCCLLLRRCLNVLPPAPPRLERHPGGDKQEAGDRTALQHPGNHLRNVVLAPARAPNHCDAHVCGLD